MRTKIDKTIQGRDKNITQSADFRLSPIFHPLKAERAIRIGGMIANIPKDKENISAETSPARWESFAANPKKNFNVAKLPNKAARRAKPHAKRSAGRPFGLGALAGFTAATGIKGSVSTLSEWRVGAV